MITKLAQSYKIWSIGSGPAVPVLPQRNFAEGSARNYSLKGSPPRKYLRWEKQTFGINLGWTDDAEPATRLKVSRWFFTRHGADTGPVKYGERIALGYGIAPSYLRYEERTVGINLGWSVTPVFEWTLLGGPRGGPVGTGERLAIHNAKACTATVPGVLIHFDRTVGCDIGWPDSQPWWDQAKDKLAGFTKEAITKLVMAKLNGC
ncbi:hypothetical protein GCM10027184_75380 [Saccharothrix stipae]